MAVKHLWKTKITDNTSDQREQVGAVRTEWDSDHDCPKTYKYIQASLTTAASNGRCLSCYNNGCTVVTDARPGSGGIKANLPAGVAIGTITNGYYAWIQVGGYHSAVDTNGSDSIAKGQQLALTVKSAGTCQGVAIGTATTTKILGVATRDDIDASDTVAAMLDCSYGDVAPTKLLAESKLTDNSSTQKDELGTIIKAWDSSSRVLRVYKYVKASIASQGTAYDGHCMACYNVGCTVVTNDISTAKQNFPAGVAVGALTHNYYGWVQIGGYHPRIKTDAGNDIARGDTLILSSSVDGGCDRVAHGTASTYKPLGIATHDDNDSRDTVAGLLDCKFGGV